MAKQIVSICLALGFLATVPTTADAQYRAPVQLIPRVTRALGHGNGFGYHTCNPGPDVSYYQPWTQKNSYLISKSPEFLARYGHELHKTPMELLHAGQTAFGHPVYGVGQGMYAHPATAVPLNADFVPTRRGAEEARDEERDEDSRLEEGGDFEGSESEENVDDRFEQEADVFDEGGEQGREPGSISPDADAQGSPSDSASEDEMTLLLPLTKEKPFLRASHSDRQ